MTVFLTPHQRLFFAGTYYPPTDRFGRPGFTRLLGWIAARWEEQRDNLQQQAERLTEYLREETRPAPSANVGEAGIRAAVAQPAQTFDRTYGRFGPAPKFPPSTALSFLRRYHRRTGDARALHMIKKTLEAMGQGECGTTSAEAFRATPPASPGWSPLREDAVMITPC